LSAYLISSTSFCFMGRAPGQAGRETVKCLGVDAYVLWS